MRPGLFALLVAEVTEPSGLRYSRALQTVERIPVANKARTSVTRDLAQHFSISAAPFTTGCERNTTSMVRSEATNAETSL